MPREYQRVLAAHAEQAALATADSAMARARTHAALTTGQ